jgi:hypothetical protein
MCQATGARGRENNPQISQITTTNYLECGGLSPLFDIKVLFDVQQVPVKQREELCQACSTFVSSR